MIDNIESLPFNEKDAKINKIHAGKKIPRKIEICPLCYS